MTVAKAAARGLCPPRLSRCFGGSAAWGSLAVPGGSGYGDLAAGTAAETETRRLSDRDGAGEIGVGVAATPLVPP